MKLLIPHDFSYEKYHPGVTDLPHDATGARLKDEILRRTDAIEVILAASPEETEAALPTAEAIVSYSVSAERLAAARKLRWIQAASAGIDHFFKSSGVSSAALAARGIILTKAAGVSRIVIGEHVFAMILALTRGVPRAVRQQLDHRWEIFMGGEVHGRTLAIVGLGEIGERVAELARAFGMTVIGTRRSEGAYHGHAHQVYPATQLDTVLGRADIIVLACSLNDATRGLMNRARLSATKRGAYLVNIARGEVLVEADLIEALQSGRIAAAALDTFGQTASGALRDLEALRPESPLWDMENVLVMPNNAAATSEIFAYLADIIVDNYCRLVAGEPVLNLASD